MKSEIPLSNASLTGRIALVTGATRGIGREVARQLAEQGAEVWVSARKQESARELADEFREQGYRAMGVELDVTDERQRRSLYETLEANSGVLDILVNNAAIWMESPNAASAPFVPVSATPAEVLRATFETNFFSTVLLTQTLLPLIRRSKGGRIVNVSSIRGSLGLLSDPASLVRRNQVLAYDSSKAALNVFTIELAAELSATNIKVNSVHPGWVKTEMGSAGADLSVEDGARHVVFYAGLDDGGPSGEFFFGAERLPW